MEYKKTYDIIHNLNAVSLFVCWKYAEGNGQRRYEWGIYGGKKAATNAYHERSMI